MIFNTAYKNKILAKILTERLARFLLNNIHESQMGFIRSKCIFDNVYPKAEDAEGAKVKLKTAQERNKDWFN